jgi:type II secretory pathway component PulL
LSSSLKNSYLKLLDLDIKKTQLKNNLNYYRQLYAAKSNDQDNSELMVLNLEEKAVELIEESGRQGLELIHYSSSREEIVLNFKGDFKPLFSFLSCLEKDQNYLEIDNLKIKKDGLDLFCYLRLVRNSNIH